MSEETRGLSYNLSREERNRIIFTNKEDRNVKNVIYGYLNIITGKWYVGQTVKKLISRHYEHMSDCKKPYKEQVNKRFNSSLNYHGPENFRIYILYKFPIRSSKLLNIMERFYIADKMSFRFGYNLTPGGNAVSGPDHHCYGKPLSEEHKRKVQENRYDNSGERNPMFGMCGPLNPNFGRKLSKERKQAISKYMKGRYSGEKNPFFGKKHTEESLIKISNAPHKKGKDHCRSCIWKLHFLDGNYVIVDELLTWCKEYNYHKDGIYCVYCGKQKTCGTNGKFGIIIKVEKLKHIDG
jgi:group I intron endonuclease